LNYQNNSAGSSIKKKMDIRKELIITIEQYENGHIDFAKAQSMIKALCEKEMTQYDLDNYWRSASIEEFVEELLQKSLDGWENIDDARALILIREILDNVTKDSLLNRNAEALEKRYAKPFGTVSGLIFHRSIKDENKILEVLKHDTVIRL
jgi:hypothetical protein